MSREVIVVGGGAGGPSAAAEAKRRDPSLQVTMIDMGRFVSYAACPMPYYIGDVIDDYKKLVARTPEKFEDAGVQVILNTKVEGIDTTKGMIFLGGGEAMSYDNLVVATGSVATLPDIPGKENKGIFVLKNLEDGIGIKEYIRANQCRSAAIVGAGFIAIEMGESLKRLGMETSIVYRGDLPVKKWDPELSAVILGELTKNGINFMANHSPVAVEKDSHNGQFLLTDKDKIKADIIIFALGVKPNVTLARDAGIAIGDTGAISVDSFQRTSREEIFSAGDCCQSYHRVSRKWVNIPLGDIANKQGRVAGLNISGNKTEFPGVLGSQSFKVFDLEVAATGLDENEAKRSGYDAASTIVWGKSMAPVMGSGHRLGIKMIAERGTGKLLGAQSVGQGGAVGRINTLSACLWSGMGLDDIIYMDFAYSPPFSAAWDLIHTAAQVLKRQL